MCLTTKMLKPKVAEKDITVYKVLHVAWEGDKPRSPYKNFEWQIGRRHSTVIQPKSFEGMVDEGFHSFASLEDAQTERNDWGGWDEYRVYKATIPAGSLYYAGKFGDDAVSYASDRLIIVEEVK